MRYKYRLRVILILIFGGFLMVATRLFYLQVMQGEHWSTYAEEIRLSRRSCPTHRGRILAEELPSADCPSPEPVELAADLPAFDIAVKLSNLDDPGESNSNERFRTSLHRAMSVDGRRVRDRQDVSLTLVQTPENDWAAKIAFSGVVLRREPPAFPIRLVWKGRYIREPVQGEECVPIPQHIIEPVRNLAAIAGVGEVELLEKLVRMCQDVLNNRANSWDELPIIEDVPYDFVLKVTVKSDDLRGFFAQDKRARRYTQGDLAGHIIGYMSKLNRGEYDEYRREYAGSRGKRYFLNDSIGRSGIEARFNAELRGSRGEELVEKDRHGRVVRVIDRQESVPGCDIYLTLLPAQQRAAEEAFAERTGCAAVIDARTGALLVLASNPRYAPAEFFSDYRRLVNDPDNPLFHRAVKSYPLGSTFKIVTALAAWDGGVSPGVEVNCNGTFRGRGPRCSARWGHGDLGFHVAFKKSCNVYFCEIGTRAGADKLAEWAMLLGLDVKTAYEPLGEESGYVPSPARRAWETGRGWWSGDTANLSIGQGDLLVTPLQAARLLAAVSTGRLAMPHVVKKIIDAHGDSVPVSGRPSIEPQQLDLPPEAVERVRRALEAVVHESGGTANRAFPDWDRPYKVGGKTSTAQRPGPSDLGWFTGMAPADNPRIAFAVAVDLEGDEHGGDIAAPIARKIIESFPDEFLTETQ